MFTSFRGRLVSAGSVAGLFVLFVCSTGCDGDGGQIEKDARTVGEGDAAADVAPDSGADADTPDGSDAESGDAREEDSGTTDTGPGDTGPADTGRAGDADTGGDADASGGLRRPCCLPSGCQMMNEKKCDRMGGARRRGASCADVLRCASDSDEVACCLFGQGSCGKMKRRKCRRNNTTVFITNVCHDSGFSCPEQPVACCDSGQCTMKPAQECIVDGGTPLESKTCSDSPCPNTRGACCHETGSTKCTSNVTPVQCHNHSSGGGTFFKGGTCGNIHCRDPIPCCVRGVCSMLDGEDCRRQGNPKPSASSCSAVSCGPIREACCLSTDNCQQLSPSTCRNRGGIVHTSGTCPSVVC